MVYVPWQTVRIQHWWWQNSERGASSSAREETHLPIMLFSYVVLPPLQKHPKHESKKKTRCVATITNSRGIYTEQASVLSSINSLLGLVLSLRWREGLSTVLVKQNVSLVLYLSLKQPVCIYNELKDLV
jgi:hypothetical protein